MPASSSAWSSPSSAVSLKWLGTAFVGLIKMIIAPVIFCTIVLGIGAIRQAAQVGRIGGLALGYFLTCRRWRWPSAWSSATSSTRATACS